MKKQKQSLNKREFLAQCQAYGTWKKNYVLNAMLDLPIGWWSGVDDGRKNDWKHTIQHNQITILDSSIIYVYIVDI